MPKVPETIVVCECGRSKVCLECNRKQQRLDKLRPITIEELRETVYGALDGKGHPGGLVGLLQSIGVEVTD